LEASKSLYAEYQLTQKTDSNLKFINGISRKVDKKWQGAISLLKAHMKKTNSHTMQAIILLTFLLIFPVIRSSAAEQSGDVSGSKSELIKALKKMQEERQPDAAQLDIILRGLDNLSDKDKRDTVLLHTLHTLGYRYCVEEYPAEAKKVLLKELEFQVLIDRESLISIWQLLCDVYILEGNLDSARWYLKQSEKQWQAGGNQEENPFILNSKALMAEYAGKILEASQWWARALEILRKNKLSHHAAAVQVNLSRIYIKLKMKEKALAGSLEAHRYLESTDMDYLKLLSVNNLASTYKLMDSLDKAIYWNSVYLVMAKQKGIEVEQAKAYMNLGNSLSRVGRFKEALSYLDSSMHISQKMGLHYGVMLYHANVGNIYIRMNRPKDALREMNVLGQLKADFYEAQVEYEYHVNMSRIYEMLNQPIEALRFYKISQGIKDSLEDKQAFQFLLEWEQLIEKERAAKEIAELNVAVSQSRLQNIIMLVSILVSGLVLYYWISKFIRREREQKRLVEEEKQRLEVDVDLKNRELASKAVLNASLSETITDIIRKLKQFTTSIKRDSVKEFTSMIRDLELRHGVEEWKEFETRFTQVHEDFHDKLLQICPELSPSELKICSLLRLNLSSKEIAVLTNRSNPTIVNARSQIRKKLQLMSEENLTSYLLSL
jgi:tetratricopeptide (TPR) repeat protein/DNA-binding CsgD family transcriptional regulator